MNLLTNLQKNEDFKVKYHDVRIPIRELHK